MTTFYLPQSSSPGALTGRDVVVRARQLLDDEAGEHYSDPPMLAIVQDCLYQIISGTAWPNGKPIPGRAEVLLDDDGLTMRAIPQLATLAEALPVNWAWREALACEVAAKTLRTGGLDGAEDQKSALWHGAWLERLAN
jgi:hypothetical protein